MNALTNSITDGKTCQTRGGHLGEQKQSHKCWRTGNSGHGGLHTCNLLFHGAIFRSQMSNPLAFYLEPTPVHLFLEKVSVTRAWSRRKYWSQLDCGEPADRVLQDGNWNLFDVVKYLGPPSPWKMEAIWFVSQSSLVNWKRRGIYEINNTNKNFIAGIFGFTQY